MFFRGIGLGFLGGFVLIVLFLLTGGKYAHLTWARPSGLLYFLAGLEIGIALAVGLVFLVLHNLQAGGPRMQAWAQRMLMLLFGAGFITSNLRAQDTGRLRYVPSSSDIAAFFHGELSESSHPALANYNARYLHLMGEKPLSDGVSPSQPQTYRLLVETRPHNTPVVVRLSIKADGTGEAVVKVSQSARFADTLTVNRTEVVSRENADDFLRHMGTASFWSRPVVEQFDVHKPVSMGAAGWILEGTREGSYHVVCRTAERQASLTNAVMFLAKNIGKLDLTPEGTLPGDGR